MKEEEENNNEESEASIGDVEEEEEEVVNQEIVQPYLFEACLIKRPGSPLLNLRVPRISADMKKHVTYI